jgi:hypothetical protein
MRCSAHEKTLRTRRRSAFSIPELIVVSALVILVGAMLIAAQLFGRRMWDITQTKIYTSDKARQLVRLLTSDVHAAKDLRIGTGTFSSFAEAPLDSPQEGNSLQIYPAAGNTNYFIRYYRDSADKKLKWMTNGAAQPTIVASAISNGVIFRIEDFAGNALTNKQNNCVIGVRLDFYEIENPYAVVGATSYYKSFQVRTKIAQRTL